MAAPTRLGLQSMPFEIRTRIYSYYFRYPIVSVWWKFAEEYGHDWQARQSLRSADELAYCSAITDDHSKTEYEYQRSSGSVTIGWLEDYSGLFGTCRQLSQEARAVLRSKLHLRIMSVNAPDPPESFKRLYFGHIRELTILVTLEGNPDHLDHDSALMKFDQVHFMPELQLVRLALPDSHYEDPQPAVPFLQVILQPETAEHALSILAGDNDETYIDQASDNLICSWESGRISRTRTAWWASWLRNVLFDKTPQQFRVVLKYHTTFYIADILDSEEFFSEAGHFVKVVSDV